MYRSLPVLLILIPILAGLTAFARYTISDFRKLGGLAGCWRMLQTDSSMLYEMWDPVGETGMAGRSFRVKGSDTVPEETVRLVLQKGTITYSPSVARQNGGRQVSFVLRSLGDSGAVFENKAHDFPQSIRYRLAGDSLFATIGGRINNRYRTIRFAYSRVLN